MPSEGDFNHFKMIEPITARSALMTLCLLASLTLKLQVVRTDEHTNEQPVPKIFDYGSFVQKFGKIYSPIEIASKAKLFLGRTLKIFQHNVLYMQKRVSYYLTQNEFTDMLASELGDHYVNGGSDLKLVDEALIAPDLPANKVDNCKLDSSNISCNLEDLHKIGSSRRQVLNFLQDQRIGNITETLNQIKELPDVAEGIANLVSRDQDQGSHVNGEQTRKENRIVKRSIVDSNNLNYDHYMVPSYGVFNEYPETMNKYYVNNIVKDYVIVDDDDLYWPTTKEDSSLSLLGSMKSIYNYMTSPTEEDIEAIESFDRMHEAVHENQPSPFIENNLPLNQKGIIYKTDWRKTGCIAKPSNQKNCNSCYAFATLSLMEFFHCRQKNELTEFSVQYIVDCGSKYQLNGCRGGKISGTGLFIKERGIELSSIYPYNGKENQCTDEASRKSEGVRPKITAWQRFTNMAAWQKWLIKSPLIVGISIPSDFLAYGGGIHDGLDCSSNITHAMLLVGDGAEDGNEFWLLKNSFAESWGESGYFRFAKSAPLRCFNSIVVVRANFNVIGS